MNALNRRLSCPGKCRGPPTGIDLSNRAVFHIGNQSVVKIQHLLRRAIGDQPAFVDHDRAVAQSWIARLVVGNDQQRRAFIAKLSNALEALVYEVRISHGKRFIDDENIRREAVARLKATRICMPLE